VERSKKRITDKQQPLLPGISNTNDKHIGMDWKLIEFCVSHFAWVETTLRLVLSNFFEADSNYFDGFKIDDEEKHIVFLAHPRVAACVAMHHSTR
jgi:hypothetical protein